MNEFDIFREQSAEVREFDIIPDPLPARQEAMRKAMAAMNVGDSIFIDYPYPFPRIKMSKDEARERRSKGEVAQWRTVEISGRRWKMTKVRA